MNKPLVYLVEITPDERTRWTEDHEAGLLIDLRLLAGQAARIRSYGSLPAVKVGKINNVSTLGPLAVLFLK